MIEKAICQYCEKEFVKSNYDFDEYLEKMWIT